MVSTDTAARERDEIRDALGPEIALDAATLVPPERGWRGGRLHRNRLKAIAGVRALLTRALAPGERMRFVTIGIRHSFLEIYFQGAFAQLNNRYALVLTSERLLMIQTHGRKLAAGDIKNDIPLAAIQRGKGPGRQPLFQRLLPLALKDGKKIRFSGIPGPDRKHLTQLLAEAASGAAGAATGMRHLCPGCLEVVPGLAGSRSECPNDACRIPLRSARRAALLSAFLPGVGDLYLRHFFTGLQELVGSMVGLLIVVAALVFALYAPYEDSALVIGLLFGGFIVLPRIIDYPLTLFMARKGNVPLSYQSPVLPRGHPLPSGTPAQPLPVFPTWVVGVFVLCGLALGATLTLAQPAARAEAHVDGAIEAAVADELDTAEAHWQAALGSGWVGANERARLALAYLQAGHPDRAAPLIEAIGDSEVDEEVAKAINALLVEHENP